MEVIFLLKAENDVQTAFNRYEEVQEGRGKLFLNHLDVALGMLRLHPEMAPAYWGRYRRLLLQDSPYALFYTLQPPRILIAAVLDLRQNPQSIRRHLAT